ncbi:MAG: ComEA family DNA-binding protein [Proteobacteria bacterium]|nr:MAG: ComEA family DNA-binding protein [Pseudomonadota bacterium]
MVKWWVLLFSLLISQYAIAIVNINSATLEELQTVKGIGPSKAEAIIQYRNTNGKFTSIHELQRIKGFGTKTVAKIESQITI